MKGFIDRLSKYIAKKLHKLYKIHPKSLKTVIVILFIVIFTFLFCSTSKYGIAYAILTSFFLTFFTFICISPFFIDFFANDFENNMKKAQQLSKTDIINNKEYYRNILNNYSSAELLYVDNFDEDSKSMVIVTLLSLINKNKISIENDCIKVINNSQDDLKESEKYILNNIKNGKVDMSFVTNVISIVKDECIKDNLIFLSANKLRSILIKAILIIELLCICWIIFMANNGGGSETPMILFLLNILSLFFIIPIDKNILKRTQVGFQMNNKLNGLKNFLNDFSNFDEKELQEIKLWDSYLIYSVMFRINKKIYQDLSNVIINYYF